MSAAELAVVDFARDRLEGAFDPGSFRPLRSAVGDGVLGGAGTIEGRTVFGWAQDASHRGGSLGAAGGETIARIFALAARAEAPVLGFPESGGARVDEGLAGLSGYAAIFRAITLHPAPVAHVVCGACAGGAAYGCALGDVTIAAGPEARLFLTGPRVVEQVTREQVTMDDLGGVRHQSANGVVHIAAASEADASAAAREALMLLCARRAPRRDPLAGDPSEPLPQSPREVYDVRDVARRLLDGGDLLELAPRWARNLVTGLARIDGRPVGLIGNQPRHLGGTLDAAAAQKGAWFVDLCDRRGIPLLVLVDTPGFLPGLRQERDAIIRHGASFVRAFARARVPRVTLTLRQAFGGAHIVMNARDLGSDLTLAWPGSRLGVMGARQAVEVTGRHALAAGADRVDLEAAYEMEHLDVTASAERGYVDEIVEPYATRETIAATLDALS